MDRFIVYHLLEFHQYTQTLKSNMDRFIGVAHLIDLFILQALKSNMDRFIDNVTPLFYLKLIL